MAYKAPKYPDLKYKYIRGLLVLERNQRHHHFMKSAAEWTSKAIVSLDLHTEPIKSVAQASQLEGIGSQVAQKLQGIGKEDKFCLDPPPAGKYLTSGPALLIGLYQATRQLRAEECSPSKGKCAKVKDVVPEATVVKLAKDLCEERFKDADDPGFCPALYRMQGLITRGCVKKRTLKKQPAYELLPYGEQLALSLIGKTKTPPTTPSKARKVTPRKELGNVNQNLDALYTNDTMTNGLILLIDTQEWGGDRVGLGRLAQLFGQSGVTYRTKRLSHGDYQWIWRSHNKEWTMPLLVERKRADDLAHSLMDGRFHNQIANMKRWREQFLQRGVDSSLKYLIEGDPEQYVVKCVCGCRGVGKCKNPNPEFLQDVIEELDRGGDVDVIRTEHMEGSISILVTITAELKHRISCGEFDLFFTTRPGRDLGDENKLLGDQGAVYGRPASKPAEAALAKPPQAYEVEQNHNKQYGHKENGAKKSQKRSTVTGTSAESSSPPKRKRRKRSLDTQFDDENTCTAAKQKRCSGKPFSIGAPSARTNRGDLGVLSLDSGSGDEDILSTINWMDRKSQSSRWRPTSPKKILVSDTNTVDACNDSSSVDSDDPVCIPESDFLDNNDSQDRAMSRESPLPCQSRLLDLNPYDDFLPDLGQSDSFYELDRERDSVNSQRQDFPTSGSSRCDLLTDTKRKRSVGPKNSKKKKDKSSLYTSSPNGGKVYIMKRKRSRSDSCSSTERPDDLEQCLNEVSKMASDTGDVDKIRQVKVVLPHVSDKLIKKKLQIYDGDVESAVLALLEHGENPTSSNDFEVVDLT